MISWTYETYLEEIARCLGGRVAEKMYTSQYSSGANSDLNNATQIAKDMLLKYGLSSGFTSRNMETDRSEKQTEEMNIEVDRIIAQGYKRAEEILKGKLNEKKSAYADFFFVIKD